MPWRAGAAALSDCARCTYDIVWLGECAGASASSAWIAARALHEGRDGVVRGWEGSAVLQRLLGESPSWPGTGGSCNSVAAARACDVAACWNTLSAKAAAWMLRESRAVEAMGNEKSGIAGAARGVA